MCREDRGQWKWGELQVHQGEESSSFEKIITIETETTIIEEALERVAEQSHNQ